MNDLRESDSLPEELSTPPIIRTLHDRALEIQQQMQPISQEKRKSAETTMKIMASVLPEATLVGGWALRLHLQQRGLPIPKVPQLDLDYTISQENYDRLRSTLRFPDEELKPIKDDFPKDRQEEIKVKLRRKGDREFLGGEYHDFTKTPGSYMAIETIANKEHVDLFATQEETNTQLVSIDGVEIKVLTPEELFYRRILQLRKYLDTATEGQQIRIPSKVYQYFFLTGVLIDRIHMQDLWNKKKQAGSWEENVANLVNDLQNGIETGSYTLVDVYH